MVRLYQANAVANVHLFNLYMPMILKGSTKKIIAISSGHADIDLVPRYNLAVSGSYAVSKAALNMIVAKFSAEYRKHGVLVMSVSPGVADTGNNPPNSAY